MKTSHAIVAAVLLALVGSHYAVHRLTASHWENECIRHGWAHRVRWAGGGSEVRFHKHPDTGTWR